MAPYDRAAHAAAFARAFGGPPRGFYRAPGRINLIGEHTDYNQGWVMPGAIGLAARVAIAPRADRRLRLASSLYPDTVEFELGGSAPPSRHWSSSLFGVAVLLERAGHRLRGADALIESAVPVGAGLSSSAAVEVACGLAFAAEAGVEVGAQAGGRVAAAGRGEPWLRTPPEGGGQAPGLDRTELALLCQQASHEFGGTRCGIMDLYIACHGRRDQVLLLDTRSMGAQWLSWPAGAALVVCNTGVRHDNATNEYNQRRAECETAVRLLAPAVEGLGSLRDLDEAKFEAVAGLLPEPLRARARHVVGENARVLAAAAALRGRDFAGLGKLLQASHRSLRDDYGVSCAKLDLMVELCLAQPGVYGARMMGGGFGGCVLALVEPARVEAVAEQVAAGYAAAAGLSATIWPCRLAAGASREEDDAAQGPTPAL
ncbi:MAG TPA: galactokinase family protein [Terriglobales bacterium]|nr:galactokinase family protein [Terriglobales bacterium]